MKLQLQGTAMKVYVAPSNKVATQSASQTT